MLMQMVCGDLLALMLAKAILHCPPWSGRMKRYVAKEISSSRLQHWIDGNILELSFDVRSETNSYHASVNALNISTDNTQRSLRLASKG